MKFTTLSIALFLLLGSTAAFAPVSTTNSPLATSSALGAAIELVAEPEGGEEITAVKTMEGSRMKKMGEAEGLTGVRDDGEADEEEGTIYKYWLKARVEGPLVQEIHGTVLRESAKKANFPGFRKGQVPPFAMPQIRGFAVEESVIRTCQSAVDAYGLKSVSGSDGQVEILEDMKEVAKSYKLGDDLEFTSFFNAYEDPAVQPPPAESAESEDGVIDAEAEAVASE